MLPVVFILVVAVGYVSGKPADAISSDQGESRRVLEECQKQQSDIYFLLDSSSSLLLQDFEKVRDFTMSFVEKLDIGPNATRVGLGVFADDFFGQFDFGSHSSKRDVVEAIKNVPYYGGGTYTGKGLQGMRTTGFQEGVVRKNATKIGVVITDGRSRHRTNTIREAGKLKDEGVWLFAIGVGGGVDEEELSIFASQPHTEFLRHVDSFPALSTLTQYLVTTACRLQPPDADNATCGRKQKSDILFIYNAAAISAECVSHVQNFTENVIQAFSMTSGNVRVGVVSEGRQGGDIALSKYIRKEDFVNALKHQPKPRLASLLQKARQQGFEPDFGGRPNSKKFAIVFVDDVNVSIDALVEARMMMYYDVTVYVIEVGLKGDKERVDKLPSSSSHVSAFDDYSDLRNKAKQNEEFVKKLCDFL